MVSISNSISYGAQYSIFAYHAAMDQVNLSTQRLATGNRLINASDDIAAMAVSTKIDTQLSGLRSALQNTTQASSLLQTAYDGLNNISDILTDMQALAVTANDGSLTPAQHAALQLQFEELSAEIDSIANGTSFNGIDLINGNISEENRIDTYETAGTKSSADLSFAANVNAGETIVINGTALTEGTDFAAGATVNDTLNNIASAINNSTDTSINNLQATVVAGSILTLEDRAAGTLGNINYVDQGTSTATFTTNGATTAQANLFSFQNGSDVGFSKGTVTVSGTIGDSLVNAVSQERGRNIFTNFLDQNPTNNQRIEIDTGTTNGDQDFFFRTTATLDNHVQIGATPEETMQNLIETVSTFSGTVNYVSDQLEFIRDGQDLIIRNRLVGNGVDFNGGAFEVDELATPLADDGNFLTGGANTGVNVDGVTNKDFYGSISGFSATFNAADDITASITVGDFTYEAEIDDTTPAANGFVRFKSTTDGGGYFDVELASGGLAVADQTDADTYAARLDAAFGGLTFAQNRRVESFTGSGVFAGASLEINMEDFSGDLDVNRIDITEAPVGGDATIEIEINGETFRSKSKLGDSIGAYETIELVSTTSTNQVTLRMGSGNADLSSTAGADTAEANLETSLGLGSGEGILSFQIGDSATNTLDISIGSATMDSLFDGDIPRIDSQANAAAAETAILDAIDEITLLMGQAGAYQSRANFAADALQDDIVNKEQAYSDLADTDIAAESAILANATVQAESAIAVLAQTNTLQSSLLTLLQVNN